MKNFFKPFYAKQRPHLPFGLATIALTTSVAAAALTDHYRHNVIHSEKPTIIRALFGEEGVLDTSKESRAYVHNILNNAQTTTIFGSIKLHDTLLTNFEIEQAFINNPNLYIGTEARLSEAERRSGEAPKTALQRLDRIPMKQPRTFSFNHCNNSHIKVVINPEILIIGTTNYDTPRHTDGTPYKQWFGDEENVSDFMLTITDPSLLKEFAGYLMRYLPPEVQSAFTASFRAKGVELESALSSGAVDPFSRLKAIEGGKSATMFAWGPESHKALILEMIKSAKKSITILQQDMQDREVQAALLDRAKNNIKINIYMSRYPFRKPNLNPAIPFFDHLTKASTETTVTLVDDKNSEIRHIHSKLLVIDDKFMYLGSANFFEGVLEPRHNHLNVGVITSEKRYLSPVLKEIQKLGAQSKVQSSVARVD